MTDRATPSPRALTRLGFVGNWGYLAVFGLGWLVLNHFFPPFSPHDPAEETARLFLENRTTIMLGSVVIIVAELPLFVFAAAMVLVVRRAEGGWGVYSVLMLLSQGTYLVMNFYVGFFFAMATFRAERAPELVQFAGDVAFMQFIGGITMFLVIWIVPAWMSLTGPRDGAVIPRWYGYVNLWCVILYLPEYLIFFFRTGPFAWDGIVGFFIPAVVFILYFVVTPFAVRQIAHAHPGQPAPA